MKTTLESLISHYGDESSVQIPNEIFPLLANGIRNKSGKSNVQQVSFAYSYIAHISLLYKYSFFVDFENESYVQNGDIKEWLGYSRTTKTINRVIKKDGILDSLGVTETEKDYPLFFNTTNEKINDIPVKDFYYILDPESKELNSYLVNQAKVIVQNRNYEIKKPIFLFNPTGDREYGTMYDYSNTHSFTAKEALYFFTHPVFNAIDFSIYNYVKSKAKGMKGNRREISLRRITEELGLDEKTLYAHLKALKASGVISVQHRGWKAYEGNSEANTYQWNGVSNARELDTHEL